LKSRRKKLEAARKEAVDVSRLQANLIKEAEEGKKDANEQLEKFKTEMEARRSRMRRRMKSERLEKELSKGLSSSARPVLKKQVRDNLKSKC
jgi:hypothetical protein